MIFPEKIDIALELYGFGVDNKAHFIYSPFQNRVGQFWEKVSQTFTLFAINLKKEGKDEKDKFMVLDFHPGSPAFADGPWPDGAGCR
jgi:hypothetical protein